MTGEGTVRHEHRTVSNSGASVSEPEVGRSLLTPDEVMRLGEEEMLVFTAGHYAVRTAKLRHFRYPLFNQRVGLKPPAQSDSTVSAAAAIGEQEKANEAASTAVVAVNGAAARTGAAGGRAAPDRNGAATAAKHDGGHPKRFLKFATDKAGARH